MNISVYRKNYGESLILYSAGHILEIKPDDVVNMGNKDTGSMEDMFKRGYIDRIAELKCFKRNDLIPLDALQYLPERSIVVVPGEYDSILAIKYGESWTDLETGEEIEISDLPSLHRLGPPQSEG